MCSRILLSVASNYTFFFCFFLPISSCFIYSTSCSPPSSFSANESSATFSTSAALCSFLYVETLYLVLAVWFYIPGSRWINIHFIRYIFSLLGNSMQINHIIFKKESIYFFWYINLSFLALLHCTEFPLLLKRHSFVIIYCNASFRYFSNALHAEEIPFCSYFFLREIIMNECWI